MNIIDNVEPGGQGEDQGNGTENDYNNNNEYIGPESTTPVEDNPKPVKKDSVNNAVPARDGKPIGALLMNPKKEGLPENIFKKKDKDKKE
ncbi:MAG: hypothetical protein WDO71_27040 [Bacteroidota bacterium]